MGHADDTAPRRALLLIDFQYDFLADDGRMPVDRTQVKPVVAAARSAIDKAHGAGDRVVRIGNEFKPGDFVGNALRRRAAIAGSPGTCWDPRDRCWGLGVPGQVEEQRLLQSRVVSRPGRAPDRAGLCRGSLCASLRDSDCQRGEGSGSSSGVVGQRNRVQVRCIPICRFDSVKSTWDAPRRRLR